MNDPLHATLSYMIQSDSWANPAMHALLNEYVKFHLVEFVATGCVVLILLLFSLLMWIRFTRTPRTADHKWAFEKKVYFSFGLLSIVVSLFFALVCVANASNTFDPVPGFAYLATSSTTTDHSAVGHALNEWITSGNSDIPPVIQQKVQERLAWQGPKAIVSGILLVVGVALSLLLWDALLKSRRVNGSKWTLPERTCFVGGIVAVAFSLLMLVLVLANMQAALAPLTITVLGVGGGV
jgi:hypothetical protein